jgi:transposase
VAATRGEAMPRIEIVGERRRAHTAEFRAHVVAESLAAGSRVQDVAERHGICPSLIYRWRRGIDPGTARGSSVRLLPVSLADAPDETEPSQPQPRRPVMERGTGSIEIELAGDVRVRVDDTVSLATLRRVMSVLRG